MSATMEQVEWEEVRMLSQDLFHVWAEGSEQAWAEYAWGALTNRRLTGYRSELERTAVILRLFALSIIYQGFCAKAFDEGSEAELPAFFGDFGLLETFSLGRLAERAGLDEETTDEYGEFNLSRTIGALANRERPAVARALRAELGDADLFASLWISPKPDVTYPVADDVADFTVNTNVTASKMHAHSWILDNMS